MPTAQEILQQLTDALTAAASAAQQLSPFLPPTTPPLPPADTTGWIPIEDPPAHRGYYPVKMIAFGHEFVGYSTWTGFQWANCFPVQDRIAWLPPE